MNSQGNGFMITGKLYNFAKNSVLIYLPAASAAYFTLAAIWDLPNAEQVVGTIAVITTFLGACLKISINNYDKASPTGELVITQNAEGGKTFSLELDATPEDIENFGAITFQVKKAA